MFLLRSRAALTAALVILPCWGTSAWAHRPDEVVERIYRNVLGSAPSAAEVRAGVEAIRSGGSELLLLYEVVDSPACRDLVSDDVYIVSTYQQLLGRDPSAHEWLIARHFVVEEGVRSLLIAGLLEMLGPDALAPWPQGVPDTRGIAFSAQALAAARPVAETLAELRDEGLQETLAREDLAGEVQVEELLEPVPVSGDAPDTDYEVYYGYLHSHTNVSFDAWQSGSDGPKEAYRYAREEGGLDWFGVSDHAEYISTFVWNNEWKLLKARADEANEPGQFVALRGFEYSNPLYGHSVVFNTDRFVSAFGAPTQRAFYRWLRRHEGAIATFNHPGDYDDLGIEFYHWAYYPKVDPMYIGQEKLQSGDNFGAYSIGYGGELSYLEEALRAGWHLGAFSAQDNHSNGWGTIDDNRTGVLATELTRAAIIDAISKRRFFATTDVNLELSFQINGQEMGSVIAAGDLELVVRCSDRDLEGFSRVQVFRGVELIHDEVVTGPDVQVMLERVAEPAAQHFYAFVTQEDGGQAMSAPIWLVVAP